MVIHRADWLEIFLCSLSCLINHITAMLPSICMYVHTCTHTLAHTDTFACMQTSSLKLSWSDSEKYYSYSEGLHVCIPRGCIWMEFKTILLLDKQTKKYKNKNSILKQVQNQIFVFAHARTVSVSFLHSYPGQWNRQVCAKALLIFHQSLNLIITPYCYS